jgi:hypothetical protein
MGDSPGISDAIPESGLACGRCAAFLQIRSRPEEAIGLPGSRKPQDGRRAAAARHRARYRHTAYRSHWRRAGTAQPRTGPEGDLTSWRRPAWTFSVGDHVGGSGCGNPETWKVPPAMKGIQGRRRSLGALLAFHRPVAEPYACRQRSPSWWRKPMSRGQPHERGLTRRADAILARGCNGRMPEGVIMGCWLPGSGWQAASTWPKVSGGRNGRPLPGRGNSLWPVFRRQVPCVQRKQTRILRLGMMALDRLLPRIIRRQRISAAFFTVRRRLWVGHWRTPGCGHPPGRCRLRPPLHG